MLFVSKRVDKSVDKYVDNLWIKSYPQVIHTGYPHSYPQKMGYPTSLLGAEGDENDVAGGFGRMGGFRVS